MSYLNKIGEKIYSLSNPKTKKVKNPLIYKTILKILNYFNEFEKFSYLTK